MSTFGRIAALTIVSRNYISAARTLATSFLEHHPKAQFFVLLVDEPHAAIDAAAEPYTLLNVEDVPLPNKDSFLYHYSILELNTAVKPYTLRQLLETREIDKIAYIDPDIRIYRPMNDVWDALDENDVVLTPHLLRPYFDRRSPSEVAILQSGTYNLGFIGLKNSTVTLEMLDWWCEKLYLDCVVDIPNGLFTDQKWMDLVPGLIEKTKVLRDPSYNVAYWNLHDREVTVSDNRFYVEGIPLTFFHFSGYSPRTPQKLSKHQSRHDLDDLPVVRRLCDEYAAELVRHGYRETASLPYAFGRLPNGIPVSGAVQWVLRHCTRNEIPVPSPRSEPDKFCEFLMTATSKMPSGQIAPIASGILMRRRDVASAFPSATWNHRDPGFENWIVDAGVREENLGHLFRDFRAAWEASPPVRLLRNVLAKRVDLRKTFSDPVRSLKSFHDLVGWIEIHGVTEEGFRVGDGLRVAAARGGFGRVLAFYAARPDLQKAFPDIHTVDGGRKFFGWLRENSASISSISSDDLDWYEFAADELRDSIVSINLMYNGHLRDVVGEPLSMFSVIRFESVVGFDQFQFHALISWLVSDDAPTPLQQLEAFYSAHALLTKRFPAAFTSREQLRDMAEAALASTQLPAHPAVPEFRDRLLGAIETYRPDRSTTTVVGYFDAPTGIGEAGRTLATAIETVGEVVSRAGVPFPALDEATAERFYETRLVYGWPGLASRRQIVVANADATDSVRQFLPKTAKSVDQSIAHWVWETEELPASQAKKSRHYDEIWAPSTFAKLAIEAHAKTPVRIVPYFPNFAQIDTAKRDRKRFRFPEGVVVFGCFFDPNSVIERKNPLGVIEAFRNAFSDREDVLLIVKANAPSRGGYAYEAFRAKALGVNIRLVEDVFERPETLDLLASLDVFVSLHRAEGFGLVLTEAMNLRVPTISTNYSGNVDFVDESVSELVPAVRIRTNRTYLAYPPRSVWSEPDLSAASAAMIRMLEPNYRRELADRARSSIRARLVPELFESILTTATPSHSEHSEVEVVGSRPVSIS